jgi:Uma2 family endonuclease
MQSLTVEHSGVRHIGSSVFTVADDVGPLPKKWTSDEYYRLGDLGFFDGKRVELIEGEIIEMVPIGSPHATGVALTAELFRETFGKDYYVRTQSPIDAGDLSQPEPDVAVIAGKIRDYSKAHPQTALLAVEVSDSTLSFDRTVKSRLYARTGIDEYWILDLKGRCLEVYRKRIEDPVLGFIYSEQIVLTEDQSVAPLANPDWEISVADMLP